MWILADVIFFIGFVVSALLVGAFVDVAHTRWFDRRHPCTCPSLKPRSSVEEMDARERCPRHNAATAKGFDRVDFISIAVVIVAAFVAALEFHRRFAWWH